MAEPAIDVLLPVYNAADTLGETMRSVQAQTVANFRVLAIDDGSTDGSTDLIAQMAAEDPRIELLRKPNGGIVDALNFGIERLRAPLTARQDADDLCHPLRFAEQMRYLAGDPACVAVSGCARHIDERGRPIGTYALMRPPQDCDAAAVPSREPYLMHPFLMVRRETLQAVGGYRYAFHSEDTDLYWRLMELGRLHNLPCLLGDYRIHSKSISSASVLNGRIAAVTSQLAGLSHRRRVAGRPDLSFPASRLAAYKAAYTAEGVAREAARDLEPQEASYFRIAFAAKLMELASYRPYRLEPEDYAFIRGEVERTAADLKVSDADNVRFLYVRTQARLLRRLQFRQFSRFAPLGHYPKAAALAMLKRPSFLRTRAAPPPPQAQAA